MARTTRLARPIGIGEIASMLGYTEGSKSGRHQKVLRYLRRIEKETGAKILTKTGSGNQTKYTTTIPVLREHVPELFYRREETQEALREYIEEMDEKLIRKTGWLAKTISNKIQALEARIEKLEARSCVNCGSRKMATG